MKMKRGDRLWARRVGKVSNGEYSKGVSFLKELLIRHNLPVDEDMLCSISAASEASKAGLVSGCMKKEEIFPKSKDKSKKIKSKKTTSKNKVKTSKPKKED